MPPAHPGLMEKHHVPCGSELAACTHCCPWVLCKRLGVQASTPPFLQRTFRFILKGITDVNSMHSYLEAKKTCKKSCREMKSSCLQWRRHHVELLPSAATRPHVRWMAGARIHFQQNFSPESAILPYLRTGKLLSGLCSGSEQIDLSSSLNTHCQCR